ncbi:hypothetical protein PFICI_09006 [Pestalotiopsis fici W106-1]|uniref:GET complex subunit GET2 n=1 Tax=Pestalotiopsis fici (strain W106-1 / CGMCC3.15140) TaxID=1229662 RepID=W3WZ61_PESFW|nr:uncharacterized protein PFICI_09006 [Pestalotiopsis fici W106-1]ETS79153.1 hypothetical protein PFICI_09006 [Pestalotiopsis fici W106-1]
MTETAPAPEDAAAARAAEQARLRKERREAKIKAGGTARLNKITGLGGGFQRDAAPAPSPEATTTTTTTTTPPQSTATAPPSSSPSQPSRDQGSHDDPEEVDISQHFYTPQQRSRPAEPSLSDAQLRQMMLGFEGPGAGGAGTPPPGGNPFLAPGGGMPPGMEGMEGLADDPMMKMMQQLMGGAGAGGPGGGNPFAGTGLEGLFGGAAGGPEGLQAQQAAAVTDKSANVWRILHAVFALGLGLYIALSTTFTGAKAERDFDTLSMANSGTATSEKDGEFASFATTDEAARSIEQTRAYFFYVFSSIEAVLLTTRYFLDKNRAPPTGIVWTISGFLPGNLRSGVRHALRYGEIFSTVRSDALVCVFVLGVCCWVRSA